MDSQVTAHEKAGVSLLSSRFNNFEETNVVNTQVNEGMFVNIECWSVRSSNSAMKECRLPPRNLRQWKIPLIRFVGIDEVQKRSSF